MLILLTKSQEETIKITDTSKLTKKRGNTQHKRMEKNTER